MKVLFLLYIIILTCSCTLTARIYSLNQNSEELDLNTPVSSSLLYSLTKNYFTITETITLTPSIIGDLSDFSVSPSLPTGYTLNSSTGAISGLSNTPTLSQTYSITAKDRSGAVISSTLTFEVANEFTVNTTGDLVDRNLNDGLCITVNDNCSLRAAIEESNNQPTGILILVNLPAGTYGLTTQSLTITSRIILNGTDRNTTVIDANPDATPLNLAIDILSNTTDVIIKGVSIKNALSTAGVVTGVGIKSTAKNLILKDCKVSDNTATGATSLSANGVGLYHNSTGKFEMDNCILTNNNSTLSNASSNSIGGGAYISAANINIKNSTVSNNSLSTTVGVTRAGGLFLSGPSLLENTVVSANQSRNSGGAVQFNDNSEIKDSTFSENRGTLNIFGAHIYSPQNKKLIITTSTFDTTAADNEEIIYASGSELIIKNSTFKADISILIQLSSTASAYIESTTLDTNYNSIDFRVNQGTLTIKSSVVRSGNINCTSHTNPIVSLGYNIFSDSSCTASDPRDIMNADPLLNGLANNGGTTMTISTMNLSPARNLVPIIDCLTADQRGVARTGNFCDAGSFQH